MHKVVKDIITHRLTQYLVIYLSSFWALHMCQRLETFVYRTRTQTTVD